MGEQGAVREQGISAFQAARQAKEQLSELTGLQPDTVSGLTDVGDQWQVTVEMVEMRRIPDSSDVLGTYEALLDAQGNLLSYRRTRRYHRGEKMGEA